MPRYEIRLGGLGGQGIVLAGVILGTAAAIFDGKNATQTQSYGPEARGGACKSEVVISDSEIDYPKLERPDLVGVMSQEAFEKYVEGIKPEGVVIYDPDMVPSFKEIRNAKVYAVPTVRMAEKLGKRIVANMVMIGSVTAASKILDPRAVEKAIVRFVPRGTDKLNLEAFRTGYDFTLKLTGESKGVRAA
jgi:2-oxoglutarate ferredoxin oxidoreductase subunit gamma